MFIQQLLRRLTSSIRRIAEFAVDIVCFLVALCVEIVDRFESKE
jgi:hypothetical protein